MSFINSLKKFSSTTVGLMAIGIGSTLIIVGGYRLVIKPKLDRNNRAQSELYADFIFQQERLQKLPEK